MKCGLAFAVSLAATLPPLAAAAGGRDERDRKWDSQQQELVAKILPKERSGIESVSIRWYRVWWPTALGNHSFIYAKSTSALRDGKSLASDATFGFTQPSDVAKGRSAIRLPEGKRHRLIKVSSGIAESERDAKKAAYVTVWYENWYRSALGAGRMLVTPLFGRPCGNAATEIETQLSR